jgi:plastocyanin
MRRATLLLFLILLVIGGTVGYYFATAKEIIVVTLTENGFEPNAINITEGDTVRFTSTLDRPFWPASNAHPSHGIFPEFDPKEPITSGDSWDFTFEQLGSWKYHDHLSSEFTGVINVYSLYGRTTSDCVDREATLMQEKCWIEEFKSIHAEKGFDGVFELFESYQKNDDLFSRNCHDIMHLVGDFAYEEYMHTGEVFDQTQTSYCAYGFYHGFIERMIAQSGDYSLSRTYCERLRTEGDFESELLAHDAEQACVHGFGHAVFDSLDGSLWGDQVAMSGAGLRACEEVFDDEERRAECGTGVWNALANAYSKQMYNFHYTKDELPFGVCRQVADLYKPGCYVEMLTQFSSWNENTADQSLQIIRNIVEPVAKNKAYYAYISDNVQWHLPYDYKVMADFADMCYDPENLEPFEWCLRGVHYGILKLTNPHVNKTESQKVCDQYEAPKKAICESTKMGPL